MHFVWTRLTDGPAGEKRRLLLSEHKEKYSMKSPLCQIFLPQYFWSRVAIFSWTYLMKSSTFIVSLSFSPYLRTAAVPFSTS